jgi:hypothetical protein
MAKRRTPGLIRGSEVGRSPPLTFLQRSTLRARAPRRGRLFSTIAWILMLSLIVVMAVLSQGQAARLAGPAAAADYQAVKGDR